MSCLRPNPPDCNFGPVCPTKDGCIPGVCPDFQIKRNDTRPPFRVCVEDENGPIDLTGLVLEASMWALGKLKTDISETAVCFGLADNIGFFQILPGDLIIMDQVRSPEAMTVTGFDEKNKLIKVERGVNGTTATCWKKGNGLRIFRFKDAPATTEMKFEDIDNLDGTKQCNQLVESCFIYEWSANDTCVPGCYRLEFKLLKMSDSVTVPSVTPICFSGVGVEWVRRFPNCGEFLIEICDSPTAEVLIQLPSVTCPTPSVTPIFEPVCDITI